MRDGIGAALIFTKSLWETFSFLGSKITRSELTQIQDLIDAGVYLNAPDFVREAIRDKLAAIKVIKCRDVDYETAKKEIIGYSRESKRHIRMRSLRI